MSQGWSRRVLLVEDQQIVRVLLADALQGAGFAVSAHPDAASALSALAAFDPDVLVTDIDLGSRPDGTELAAIVRARSAPVEVVFVTNYPGAAAPRGARLAGATLVTKDLLGSTAELVRIVDAAARAGRPAPVPVPVPEQAQSTPPEPPAVPGALDALSRAQLEAVRLLAEGCSNEEIARRTGRTLRAVERLLSRSYARLGLAGHAEQNPRVAAVTAYTRVFGHPAASGS